MLKIFLGGAPESLEVTHDNLDLQVRRTPHTPEGFVLDGCFLGCAEKDFRLGEVYPHLPSTMT